MSTTCDACRDDRCADCAQILTMAVERREWALVEALAERLEDRRIRAICGEGKHDEA